MGKNNLLILEEGSLFDNTLKKALEGFGTEPEDEFFVKRKNFKFSVRVTKTNRQVKKVETESFKASETMYPSGKPVYTFSPKKKK